MSDVRYCVREATVDDIEAIVEMGCNFIAGTQYASIISPDRTAMCNTVTVLIQNHVIFVLELFGGPLVGMLGMGTYSHVVSGQTCATEMFWWIEPIHRGRGITMLRQAERWARSRGATLMQMIQPESEPQLGDVYCRLGYIPTERQFQKVLS